MGYRILLLIALVFLASSCTDTSNRLDALSNITDLSLSQTFKMSGCIVDQVGAPCLLYTDALSDPIAGGEDDNGAYLSIYGLNFGTTSALGSTTKVFIGGHEVAKYFPIEQSAVYPKFGIMKLTVQVGHLGNPSLGTPLPVKVCINRTQNCSNDDNTFTPNDGRIFYVSLSGDDLSAGIGDINHPWRHLQMPGTQRYGQGVYPNLRAGDHVVIRSGNWNDIAFEGAWLRFRDPNAMGAPGKWIHFTAYPGETVTYTTPAGAKGGFQGPGSAYAGTTGEYISMSNFHMIVDGNADNDAAPFNQQYGTGPWRVVNNEIGPWPALGDARAGGYSGGGQGTKILGNYIHDIRRICDTANQGSIEFNTNCTDVAPGGETLLNHGVYIDGGADNVEVAHNIIQHIGEGNLLQTYSSNGLPLQNINIHHNWMENGRKFGLNISHSTYTGVIYNNVVKDARLSGMALQVANYDNIAMNLIVAHNTFINNDKDRRYGQITDQYGSYGLSGTVLIANNIFYTNEAGASTFFGAGSNSSNYCSFDKNLFWDGGKSSPSGNGTIINADPLFMDIAADDFRLQTGSPAIDVGTTVPGITLNDFLSNPRPVGTANDLGAYEYAP